MNPLRRIFNLFRRRPGMVGIPPSARQVTADPGLHAVDFSLRYADSISYHVENRMMELGLDPLRIGMPDIRNGNRHAAFHPHGRDGGNVSPDGRMIADSGLFNLDLLKADYGEEAGSLFGKSRLLDRLDSIIAHEYEEHRHGMIHVEALNHASMTDLPISDRARVIAEAMRKGWNGR